MDSPGTSVTCRKTGIYFCPQRSQSRVWSCWWVFPSPLPVWCPGYGWCPDHLSWKGRGPSGSRDPLGNPRPAAPAGRTRSDLLRRYVEAGKNVRFSTIICATKMFFVFFVYLPGRKLREICWGAIWTTLYRVDPEPLELSGLFCRTETLLVGYSMCWVKQPLFCRFWLKSHRNVRVRPFPKS